MEAELHFQNRTAIALYERAIRAEPGFYTSRRYYLNAVAALDGPDEAQRRHRQLPPARDAHIDFGKAAGALIAERALELELAGDHRGAEVLLATTAALISHPRERITLISELILLLRRTGQAGRARQHEQAFAAAVARDPRPAVRYYYLLIHMPVAVGGIDTLSMSAARIACRYRAYTQCGNSVSSVAAWHLNNGNPHSAVEFGERALAITRRDGSPYFLSLVEMRLGRAYLRTGEYARAESTLQAAIDHARQVGSAYLLAESYHNLAHSYEGRSAWPLARQTADSFVKAAGRLHDAMQIVSLRDAGLIYWDSGERVAARDYFTRMVALVDRQNSDHFWAGEFYEREGDLHAARAYYRRALSIAADTARITAGLVRVYLALGERDSAQSAARIHDAASQTPEEVPLMPEVLAVRGDFRRAIVVAESWAQRKENERNLIGAANAWLQVGDLQLRNGDARAAGAAARKAHDFAVRANLSPQRARALLLQGRAELQSDPPSASATLSRAAAAARVSGAAMLQAQVFTVLADAYAVHTQPRLALQAADSALRHFSRISDRFVDDFDRGRFAGQRDRAYEIGLRILLEQNDPRALLSWLQRHKTQGTPGNRRLLDAARVQQRLRSDELVIDYAVLDAGAVALVVTKDVVRIVPLPVTRSQLTSWIDQLRRATESHLGRIDWARATYDHRAAHLLYGSLLAPLEPYLRDHPRLFIVPDGPLHLVPFDALVSRPAQRRYLIDTHEVTYLPASSAVGSRRGERYGEIGVVRTEAPATRSEAELLAARGAQRVQPNETAVKLALLGHDIVHFATHAEADLQHPLSSFLRLEPDGRSDGYLHVGEIAALRTSARLVFLSACETQRGRVFAGIGVMGLAHAFIVSGAQSVVATQWPVGASAASVADVFYQRLQAGQPPAAALRAAKLALRADPLTADPLHWGAFMLVTSNRTP